ncbi:MAG: phosphatidate cytidylyltransferase [Thioploca sp.]|nr:phosphatidate cytidylyltransferase [Thioploca sp.]
MLNQRVITALLLIPLVIWDILNFSSPTLAWLLAVFVVLAAWEWAGICGWHQLSWRNSYAVVMGLTLFMSYGSWHYPKVGNLLLITACLWWLIAFYWVLNYQRSYDQLPTSSLIKALLGFFILLPGWAALLILHEHDHYGRYWVVFFLVLIWAADSGAYFTGKRWGKIKLADKVSPGKTWEGVIGALLMSFLVSASYAILNAMSLMTVLFFMLLCSITVMASILGDLLESVFKRQMGIKDSSQILPGHGGVLDRIDSLTAAAPIFVMGLILLGNRL